MEMEIYLEKRTPHNHHTSHLFEATLPEELPTTTELDTDPLQWCLREPTSIASLAVSK